MNFVLYVNNELSPDKSKENIDKEWGFQKVLTKDSRISKHRI